MSPSRTLLVTLAAAGLLTGSAIAAGALVANSASAAGGTSAATPAPSASSGPSGPEGRSGQPPQGQGPGRRGGPGLGMRGPGGPGGLRGIAGQGPVLHGEFVTGGANGSTTTLVIQTGTVTARNGSQITVQSTDKYDVRWTLDSNTTVRTRWAQGAVKDIAVGDTVQVEGARNGTTTTARFVAERPKGTGQGGTPKGSSSPAPSATTTS